MSERVADVIVVGAGPSGCAAAITLARRGRRVRVVDRARFPRPKTCGDALSNRAVSLVRALGAGDALDKAPHALVEGALVVFPDGKVVRRSYGSAPGWIVPRFDLDAGLRASLSAHANIDVVEGVAARELVTEGGRVTGVRTDDATWNARMVIAADGPGSIAWTASDKPRGRELAISATAYYEGVRPLEGAGWSEHHFANDLPCGYGWVFPAVEGKANVGVYLRMDTYRAQGVSLAELLSRFIARRASQFEGARRCGEVHTWQLPLTPRHRAPERDGLLVCGDAGRAVDPLTGEGIWQALYTGVLAGECADEALAGAMADAQRRYRRAVWRALDAKGLARSGVQDALRWMIDRGVYQRAWVQRALDWGYQRGVLEVTKSVGQ